MLKKPWVPFFVLTGALAIAAAGCGGGGGGKTGTAGKTGSAGTGGAGGTAGTAGAGGAAGAAGGAGGTAGAAGAAGNKDAGVDSPTDAGNADTSDASSTKAIVYANAGTSMYVFDFNPADGTLSLKPALTTVLPQVPQYAAIASPAQKYLYVAATIEPANYIYSFSMDPATGSLTPIAPPDAGAGDGGAPDGGAVGVVSPNGRAINVSLSKDNKYLLAVHNVTKAYTVFNLGADGTVGATVPPQTAGGDMNIGAFVHQIRVDPSGQYVIICDRGTDPTSTTDADGGVTAVPEGLGHLRTFGFANGVLTPIQTLAYPAGYGPRHVDFHPTKPWVYASVGRGSQITTYSFANGMLTQIDSKTSLASATEAALFPTYAQDSVNGQQASAIMVHPSGKWLWMTNTNRKVIPYTPDAGAGDAGDAGDAGGDAGDAAPAPAPAAQVYFGTGHNDITLFSIDQTTGVPTWVAATDSHGFVPRTFTLDPSGQYLIAANQKKVNTLVGSVVTPVLPNLSVFSVAGDGKLTFVKSTDLSTGDVFWVGGRSTTSAFSGD
jgi:6-phosphogluconolactonase (cycloisomerase 2 family)